MIKTTFKFQGGRELEAALSELGSRSTMRRTGERALKLAAEPIRDDAIARAPKDTGFLKDNIKIGKATRRARTRDKDVVETFVGIDTGAGRFIAGYASFDEFGREGQAAQPYMRPAFESKKQEAVDRLGEDLRQQIEISATRLAKRTARRAAKG